MDQFLSPGQCQYDGCTHCVNSNGSGRFCFTHGGRPIYVAMLCAQILLKQEDGASNMATRSQLALWMDAVISVLRVVFAKDTEATVYAMSSIVHIMYSGAICADHIILQLTSPAQ